ncbi:MAG: thioredoxin-disulfide reductase [Eggerthellaceae bacterium]|nr:thioredoxin-disulfide reductase [Eggerthellaceae bacterium]
MAEQPICDLAIIGGGPAGLTAAMYACRAGLDTHVFERISPGGQMAQTEHLENYPGYNSNTSGFDLAMIMLEQAQEFGANFISEEVQSVDFEGDVKVINTDSGTYRAKTVIVATGARPTQLGLSNEQDLVGKGISYCATCDGNFFRGKDVMVIGGGNTAAADAIYLSRICRKVYLVHRRDKLRATVIYHKRLSELDNVELLWFNEVRKFLTDDAGRISGAIVENNQTHNMEELAVSGIFIAVGMKPNTEFLNGALQLNVQGYIMADESGLTSVPGVFAAGDVRSKNLRQVVTATSDGAVCAESAVSYLEDLTPR